MATRTPLESADRAAQLLYERGARRVWAFGSLGEGHTLDVHSDVDLAVEGMRAEAIEQAKRQLRAGSCKVDIVAMEDTDAQLRWFIGRGRLIPRDGASPLANPTRVNLKLTRLEIVASELRAAGARRVLDLGCGLGWLAELLACEPQIDAIYGIDKDDRTLRRARARLAKRLAPSELARVTLAQGLCTWRDERLAGYDAVVAMEVIEHLQAPQLAAFASVALGFVAPRVAIVTTPNSDYNTRLRLGPGEYRHPDHRFEWTREEFAAWGVQVAALYGYRFEVSPIGEEHARHGAPTQLGRFQREDGAAGD